MARKAVVEYVGDADSLIRANKKAGAATKEFGGHAEKTGAKLKHLAEAIGIAFAAEKVIEFGKESVKAAANEETALTRLKVQLKATGISYKEHGEEIEKTEAKQSSLSGFTKTELTGSLTDLVRTTHSVKEGLKEQGLASDIARAKHITLDAATKLVTKANLGSVGMLKRVGIEAKAVTTNQDKVKKSVTDWTLAHKKLTPEMKAHFDVLKAQAKQDDVAATKQSLIATLTKTFAGQAKAYGDTAAGASARFHAALESVQVTLGNKLLPILSKVASAAATFLTQIQNGTGAGGRFAAIVSAGFERVKTAVSNTVTWIKRLVSDFQDGKGKAVALVAALAGFATAVVVIKTITAATKAWRTAQLALDVAMSANPIGLVVAAIAGLAVAFTVAYKKSQTFRNIVNAALNAVKTAVSATVGFIKAHWPLILSILTGPVGAFTIYVIRHFGTIKDTVKALPGKILNAMKDVGTTLLSVGSDLIGGLLKGIRDKAGDIISTIEHFVTDKIPGFIKHALGIASPSKVMAKIGEQIGEGLRNGIAAGKSALTAATKAGLLDPIDAAIAALNAKKDALSKTWDAMDVRAQRSQLVQAIATAKAGTVKKTTTTSGGGSAAGVPDSGGVASTILAVGKAMGASAKQIKAAIETGIVESGLKNLNYGDADSMGWRQERVSLYGKAHATSVKQSAIDFFSEARGFGGATPGQLAANVQRPAAQYRGRYDQVASKAQAIIDSLTGGKGAGGDGSKTTKKRVVDASAVKDAKKALEDFDKAAARAKKQARIDIQVKNLEQLKAFKDAIKSVRDRLSDMAATAAQAWRTLRESEIDKAHDAAVAALADTDQAKELARLQQTDASADDAKTKAGLDKALADAKASGDKDAIQGAEDDIAAYQRKKREDELSAWITNETTKADTAQQTAKDGLDAEEADYQTSLNNRLGALADNLATGKESYANFAKDVQGVLDSLHLPPGIPGFEGSGDEEATIGAGPGVLGLSPAQAAAKGAATASKAHDAAMHAAAVAAAKKRKPKRAAGGPVLAGYPYTVGELGPETFVPDSDGRIMPNGRGGRGGGLTIMGNVIIGNQKAARIFNNRLAHKVAFG